jgi:ubiquinone/menaquinone biosynthesis C-methylase UbiE
MSQLINNFKNSQLVWDSLADTYDERFNHRYINQYMRKISQECLVKYFNNSSHLLEIGCGTGDEAIFFAKKNKKITAIDISPKMIEIAKSKALKENIEKNVDFYAVPVEKLKSIPNIKYDGVYSSFGTLNLVSNLTVLAKTLKNVMLPSSYFIASVMNKYCLFEIFFFLIQGKLRQAFRRISKEFVPVRINPEIHSLNCYYYSPTYFYYHFRKYFSLIEFYALPLLIQAPYIDSVPVFVRKLLYKMLFLDKKLSKINPFNRFGDHFIMVMKKRT